MAERKKESIFGRNKDGKVKVEFIYVAPDAREVVLAGSFNNWDQKSLLMKKDRKGNWKTVVELAPGKYEYKYIADGYWVTDAQCTELTINSFGTTNCVVRVA